MDPALDQFLVQMSNRDEPESVTQYRTSGGIQMTKPGLGVAHPIQTSVVREGSHGKLPTQDHGRTGLEWTGQISKWTVLFFYKSKLFMIWNPVEK